jgi:hypothetical protein
MEHKVAHADAAIVLLSNLIFMMNINFFMQSSQFEEAREQITRKKIEQLCHKCRIRSCGGSEAEYRNVMKSISLLNTKMAVLDYVYRQKFHP